MSKSPKSSRMNFGAAAKEPEQRANVHRTGTELGTVTLGGSGLASGVITGGVIANAGSGMVFNEGTLDGVTFEGPLNLDSGMAHVFITSKGLIVEGAGGAGKGVVNITSSFGEISFHNTQTFTNATINLGGGIDEQDTTHLGATLTLGVNLTINQTGEYAGIDSTSYAGDAVVNRGTITAAYKGGRFEIESQTFTNLGTITVSNGDTLDLYPTKLVNLSGGTLSGGEFAIGANSMLALETSRAVLTDDATIILNGAGAAFQGGERIDSTLATRKGAEVR
jgi:hypothetical protein